MNIFFVAFLPFPPTAFFQTSPAFVPFGNSPLTPGQDVFWKYSHVTLFLSPNSRSTIDLTSLQCSASSLANDFLGLPAAVHPASLMNIFFVAFLPFPPTAFFQTSPAFVPFGNSPLTLGQDVFWKYSHVTLFLSPNSRSTIDLTSLQCSASSLANDFLGLPAAVHPASLMN